MDANRSGESGLPFGCSFVRNVDIEWALGKTSFVCDGLIWWLCERCGKTTVGSSLLLTDSLSTPAVTLAVHTALFGLSLPSFLARFVGCWWWWWWWWSSSAVVKKFFATCSVVVGQLSSYAGVEAVLTGFGFESALGVKSVVVAGTISTLEVFKRAMFGRDVDCRGGVKSTPESWRFCGTCHALLVKACGSFRRNALARPWGLCGGGCKERAVSPGLFGFRYRSKIIVEGKGA